MKIPEKELNLYTIDYNIQKRITKNYFFVLFYIKHYFAAVCSPPALNQNRNIIKKLNQFRFYVASLVLSLSQEHIFDDIFFFFFFFIFISQSLLLLFMCLCVLSGFSQVHRRWSATTMTQPLLFITSPTAATRPRLLRWAPTPSSSAWRRSPSSRTRSTSGVPTVSSSPTRVRGFSYCFVHIKR